MSRSVCTEPQQIEESHSQTPVPPKPPPAARQRRRQPEVTPGTCRKGKELRAKRPDSLGPCRVCDNNECFYYFNPKSKKGCDNSLDHSTVRWRQKCILDNFLLVMRSGSIESIDELLDTTREDRMGSTTIHCIWKNIMALQKPVNGSDEKVGIKKSASEEPTDSKIPLILQDLGRLKNQVPSPPSSTQASPTPPFGSSVWGENIDSTIEHLPYPCTISEVHCALSAPTPSPTPSGGSRTAERVLITGLPAGSRTASSCTRATSEPVHKLQSPDSVFTPRETSTQVPATHGSTMRPPSVFPENMSNHFSPARVLDIPILEPVSDFSNLCVHLRNNSREALAAGIDLEFLSNWGRMDCDLLFRDRVATDLWHLPNWACEISRRLPHMSAATRIAFALCLYRMMVFLVAPSEKTFSQLPHILRPTDQQMRIPHDMTFNFLPLPQVRSSLVYKPADWLTILVVHNFHLNWTGDWGDVGGAVMSEQGMWHAQEHAASSHQALRSDASDWDFDGQSKIRPYRPSTEKAIVYDAQSGRRYVSSEFERHCWTQENWSVSKNIRDSWPELEGHITVF